MTFASVGATHTGHYWCGEWGGRRASVYLFVNGKTIREYFNIKTSSHHCRHWAFRGWREVFSRHQLPGATGAGHPLQVKYWREVRWLHWAKASFRPSMPDVRLSYQLTPSMIPTNTDTTPSLQYEVTRGFTAPQARAEDHTGSYECTFRRGNKTQFRIINTIITRKWEYSIGTPPGLNNYLTDILLFLTDVPRKSNFKLEHSTTRNSTTIQHFFYYVLLHSVQLFQINFI